MNTFTSLGVSVTRISHLLLLTNSLIVPQHVSTLDLPLTIEGSDVWILSLKRSFVFVMLPLMKLISFILTFILHLHLKTTTPFIPDDDPLPLCPHFLPLPLPQNLPQPLPPRPHRRPLPTLTNDSPTWTPTCSSPPLHHPVICWLPDLALVPLNLPISSISLFPLISFRFLFHCSGYV